MAKRNTIPWWQSTAFVAVAGIVGIALIAWAFAAMSNTEPARAPAVAAPPTNTNGVVEMDGDVQVLRMTATDYGYEPNQFRVVAGQPVRLVVTSEARGCANAFVFPKPGINQRLVAGSESVFEFTPQAGSYPFSCSMRMFTGEIIAAP